MTIIVTVPVDVVDNSAGGKGVTEDSFTDDTMRNTHLPIVPQF